MKAVCQGCFEPVDFPDPAEPEFFNSPNKSLLIVDHPKAGYCFNCKTPVALFLRSAQITLEARPVQKKQQSPIIVASAGAVPKVKP